MQVNEFKYKSWADARTLQAVSRIDKCVYQNSYAFVTQQINHMVIVEELFKSRLLGEPPPHSSTNTEQVPDLDELGDRLKTSNRWYGGYAAKIPPVDRIISFVFTDGRKGRMSVREILFHVINHGSYHRGNIAHALDFAEVPHPIDGYGIFIHEHEPKRRET